MSRDELALAFAVGLFVLLFAGVPVGAAILLLAGGGILAAANVDASAAMATAFVSQFTSWSLTALPLFILMGEILARTGTAARIFASMEVLAGRAPGGLLQVNMLTSGLFAALSGSSTATVATIGRLSFPELERRGYRRDLSLGTLAGASTLGILIPPSVALILYGFVFRVSVADLFLAGVIPGLMLLALFSTYAAIRQPRLAEGARPTRADRLAALRGLLPFLVLIACVFGSIYGGVATPTESAVIGVFGAALLALFARTLSLRVLREALEATAVFAGALGFILGASAALQVAMAYTGIPREVVRLIQEAGLGRGELLLVLTLALVAMGCFVDGLSMIVLTGAVLLPVIQSAGIDPLWFGIYMVVLVEIALITPPIGFNLFVLQKVTGIGILPIARASWPMAALMLAMLGLLTLAPGLATFLPSL